MSYRISIDDEIILEECVESVSFIVNPPSDNKFSNRLKCRNKMTIKGKIGAGEQTIGLYQWALIDSNSSRAYKKVVVEETKEGKLVRKVCFKKAFIVEYFEDFTIYDYIGHFMMVINEFIGTNIECSSATDVPSKTKSVDDSISEEEVFSQGQKSVHESTQKRNTTHQAILKGSKGTSNVSVDELISDLTSEKIKLHDLSDSEQLIVAEALKKKSPIPIPENVIPLLEYTSKGYDQIVYKWNDGTYNYEVRWHTATPNAPKTPPNWRVDRIKPGFAGGKDPITGEKIQGYPAVKEVLVCPENSSPYYVSMKDWKAAHKAYLKNTATQEQLDMLKWGHYISD